MCFITDSPSGGQAFGKLMLFEMAALPGRLNAYELSRSAQRPGGLEPFAQFGVAGVIGVG
jgi:hypothetical protein